MTTRNKRIELVYKTGHRTNQKKTNKPYTGIHSRFSKMNLCNSSNSKEIVFTLYFIPAVLLLQQHLFISLGPTSTENASTSTVVYLTYAFRKILSCCLSVPHTPPSLGHW